MSMYMCAVVLHYYLVPVKDPRPQTILYWLIFFINLDGRCIFSFSKLSRLCLKRLSLIKALLLCKFLSTLAIYRRKKIRHI